MFKTLRFSLKKSKILAKIRKVVESRNFEAQSYIEIGIKNTVIGGTMSDEELYIAELLTLLSKDKATTMLLAESNLKFDDLRSMISNLELNGAGQFVKGHYVAVSSIAFIDTLNVLCNYWNMDGFDIEGKSREESNQIIAYQMLKSF